MKLFLKHWLPVLVIAGLSISVGRGQGSLPPDQFAVLTREHADSPCVLYNAAASPPLSLVTWQREAGLDLPTNQVILVAKSQSRLTLPAGTPFGDAGAPFWVLPQTQNPNLLYLGISVERVPPGIFSGPLAIRLTRFEGPGYFMAWQATGPGQFNIRLNTRDGVGANDFFQPLVGAHEHFNWGFSTTGVYCVTFQASGRRLGETADIASREATFVFHVLPLPPATNFPTWQKHFWPPGFHPPATAADANPDGDAFDNLREYAFASNPTNAANAALPPLFDFVTDGPSRFGSLTFTRYRPALDLDYTPEATGILPAGWQGLTNFLAIVPQPDGLTEHVTVRDFQAADTVRQRFLRVRVSLR
jgi:surface-anchored protein